MTAERKEQFQLVPVEPTLEMLDATYEAFRGVEAGLDVARIHGFALPHVEGKPPLYHAYRAMLAAAPKPQAVAEDAVVEALRELTDEVEAGEVSGATIRAARAALKSTAQG